MSVVIKKRWISNLLWKYKHRNWLFGGGYEKEACIKDNSHVSCFCNLDCFYTGMYIFRTHRLFPMSMSFISWCKIPSPKLHKITFPPQPQEGYLMVQQFQYLGWASHREVPGSKRSFLKLILQVEKWQEECEEGEGRTIIHCLWVQQRGVAIEGSLGVHFLVSVPVFYPKESPAHIICSSINIKITSLSHNPLTTN